MTGILANEHKYYYVDENKPRKVLRYPWQAVVTSDKKITLNDINIGCSYQLASLRSWKQCKLESDNKDAKPVESKKDMIKVEDIKVKKEEEEDPEQKEKERVIRLLIQEKRNKQAMRNSDPWMGPQASEQKKWFQKRGLNPYVCKETMLEQIQARNITLEPPVPNQKPVNVLNRYFRPENAKPTNVPYGPGVPGSDPTDFEVNKRAINPPADTNASRAITAGNLSSSSNNATCKLPPGVTNLTAANGAHGPDPPQVINRQLRNPPDTGVIIFTPEEYQRFLDISYNEGNLRGK